MTQYRSTKNRIQDSRLNLSCQISLKFEDSEHSHCLCSDTVMINDTLCRISYHRGEGYIQVKVYIKAPVTFMETVTIRRKPIQVIAMPSDQQQMTIQPTAICNPSKISPQLWSYFNLAQFIIHFNTFLNMHCIPYVCNNNDN